MNIIVVAIATILTILGLYGLRRAACGEDQKLRRLDGAAGVVSLVMAAACFLSLV